MLPVGVDRPLLRIPFVTLALMAINTIVFVITWLNPEFEDLIVSYGFVAGHGSLMTLFTHMFMHGGWDHLIGNLFFFAVAGLKMEDALGHWRFILFYLGCGIAANMVHVILSGNEPIPMVGASGAIAGVLGGFTMLYPLNKVRLVTILFYRLISFQLPVLLFFGFWIAREVFNLVVERSYGFDSGIAFGAHIGGFAAGALWAWGFFGWNRGEALDDMALEQRSKVVYSAPSPLG